MTIVTMLCHRQDVCLSRRCKDREVGGRLVGGVGSGCAPEVLQVGKAPERRGGPAPAFQRVGILLVSGQCTGWACEAPPCLKHD